MAHLCIQNSTLIPGRGADFDTNETLLGLLSDPTRHCVVLYPGPHASNISETPTASWLPPGKTCTILVIDGTWHCAKTMLRESKILKTLPQICFTPGRESEYQFRRQPAPHCLSTIEAIHEVLGILEPSSHADELLILFRNMVAQQIAFHPRPLSEVLL
jgi:DTW domain-containing protein YfiP